MGEDRRRIDALASGVAVPALDSGAGPGVDRLSPAQTQRARQNQPNTAALWRAAGDDSRLVRVRAATALSPVPEGSLPEDQRSRVRGAIAELVDSMKSPPAAIAPPS